MKHSTTHAIYIPGLGDDYDRFRQLILKGWDSEVLNVTFVPMNWSNVADGFEKKQARVIEAILRVPASDTIALIGESAGGAMSLCVGLGNPRVNHIVTICGKNRGSGRVRASVYQKHPAFRQTMHAVDELLKASSVSQRARITTIYSPYDRTVSPVDTLIPNALPVKLGIPGHFLSICLILTILRGYVINRLV